MPASFLGPAVATTNYTLNYFYGRGAAVWDAGWFSWLSDSRLAWSLLNPPAIGGDFFAVHMAPVFIVLAAMHELLFHSLPAPVFFALTQGVWYGVLGASLGWCASRCLPGQPGLAVGVTVLAVSNGIVLATLGFPHFEIAIPALLAAALALRLAPPAWGWLWIVPLLLLLTIREDAGLHAAGWFGVLGLWQARRGDVRAGVSHLLLAVGCAAAAGATMAVQTHLYPGGDALARVWLGSPALAHVDGPFLRARLARLLHYQGYIWVPLLLAAAVATVRRDLLLAVGVIASLPWLGLAVVAISPQAGEMVAYYGFPMLIGMVWPMLAAVRAEPRDCRIYLGLQSGMAVLSIALFATLGVLNHDPQPWRNFGFAWASRIAPVEAAMDGLAAKRAAFGTLVVDDAVAALRMGDFGPDALHYAAIYTPEQARAVDTVIYQPGTWGDAGVQMIIAAAGLSNSAALPGTPFIIRSRGGGRQP